MNKIVLRVRPVEVMEDLNPDLIRDRAKTLAEWEIEVQDTRLSDAPYITIIAAIGTMDSEAVDRLKIAFANLPRMRVHVWQGIGVEIPLGRAALSEFERAARSRERR